MTIGPKGFEATRQRFEELRAKFRVQQPEPPPRPVPMPPVPGPEGFAPLSPFAPGLGVQGTAPQSDLRSMARDAATKAGIDPALFEALVSQESGFNPGAVSSAGAMGLTQLMPGTARSLGVTNPLDPIQNLDGGARYLSSMLKQFGGDVRLALAAYNAGPGAVQRHGGVPPYKETQNYVRSIMARLGQ